MSSISPTLRMLALIQLIEIRKVQTSALINDLADIIESEKKNGTSPTDIFNEVCGETQTASELRQILSNFYIRETEFLVKLGVCESVPVGSPEEASAEAAEILTRVKGN